MFSISFFERPTCLANIEFSTTIISEFIYTYGCVFFMFALQYSFVYKVSLDCVCFTVYYVVFQLFKTFSNFSVDLL
jgi:hypothetical protein